MRLIVVCKLLKPISLIVVGVVSLKLVHGDIASAVAHWAATLGLDPGNRHVEGRSTDQIWLPHDLPTEHHCWRKTRNEVRRRSGLPTARLLAPIVP